MDQVSGMMEVEEIKEYLLNHFEGTTVKEVYGETSFFYNPGGMLPSGTYFLTIKEMDGPNDRASELDREGVFRISVGSSRETFLRMFGEVPKRPPKGGIIDGHYDFRELDKIMPHPVYGWAYWVCVLTPSRDTFDNLLTIIQEYYDLSKERFEKRIKKQSEE